MLGVYLPHASPALLGGRIDGNSRENKEEQTFKHLRIVK